MFALRLGRLRPAAALRGQHSLYSTPFPHPLSRSLHATPVAAKKVIKRSSLTPTQRKALAKQRQLAQAITRESVLDGSVLEQMQPHPPERVSDAKDKPKLNLDDLERFQPKHMPRPLSGIGLPNPRYAKRYAELEKVLNYAFKREQVIKLAGLLGIKSRKAGLKPDLVRHVMKTAWGLQEPLASEESGTFERSKPPPFLMC